VQHARRPRRLRAGRFRLYSRPRPVSTRALSPRPASGLAARTRDPERERLRQATGTGTTRGRRDARRGGRAVHHVARGSDRARPGFATTGFISGGGDNPGDCSIRAKPTSEPPSTTPSGEGNSPRKNNFANWVARPEERRA
jgi:hypothetical protein